MLKKGQKPILIANILYLAVATIYFIFNKNYEFLIYVGVITLVLALILSTNHKINYPNPLLWGMTFWGLLHMLGGSVYIGGTRLYDLMLVPLTQEIFRYDQFVHILGFAVATLVMYYLLKPSLNNEKRLISLSIVIIMAGLGTGAVNEIIEFGSFILFEDNGVGGYVNTSLDLVADLIGAIIAMAYILKKELLHKREVKVQ